MIGMEHVQQYKATFQLCTEEPHVSCCGVVARTIIYGPQNNHYFPGESVFYHCGHLCSSRGAVFDLAQVCFDGCVCVRPFRALLWEVRKSPRMFLPRVCWAFPPPFVAPYIACIAFRPDSHCPVLDGAVYIGCVHCNDMWCMIGFLVSPLRSLVICGEYCSLVAHMSDVACYVTLVA